MALRRTARQRFLDRFDPRHGGWVYRANDSAAGRWVTDAERSSLATQYGKRTILLVIAVIVDLTLALGFFTIAVRTPHPPPRMLHGLAYLLIVIPVSAAVWRAAAPWMLLRGRARFDEGPSKEDAARRKRAKETWFAIARDFTCDAVLVVSLLVFCWRVPWRSDAWLLAAAVCVRFLPTACRVVRLMRWERKERRDMELPDPSRESFT